MSIPIRNFTRRMSDHFRPQLAKGQQARAIVCVDMEGSGFKILWTFDMVTWFDVCRSKPFNAAEAERYLERFSTDHPDAEVRHHVDFHARLPEDLSQPSARII